VTAKFKQNCLQLMWLESIKYRYGIFRQKIHQQVH